PPTVFITAHGTVEHAVDVLKLGAADYVTKPFEPESLINILKAITIIPKSAQNDPNKCELGISSSMMAIQKHLNKLARYHTTPLLITGESGVGKEVVSRYLHQQQENDGPFIAVNCSAIPESLIESELFGHEKGAFTGATRIHRGVFEQAHGGTLLLDEIGEMPLFMQSKLLRVLQDRAIKRVGGEEEIDISVRLIFATNKDLEQQVIKGQFREDLFFRINVIHTTIPALRKRKEDILWLSERFIKEHQENYPGVEITLHESAKLALLNHTWPGNIRELKHAIERACILSNNSILREQDILTNPNEPERTFGTSSTSLKGYLESLEKEKIESVLLQHNGCINQSADHLNISRKSLWEKMKKYDIEK
ncbi:MAG: sigma-54 dependent transcriptional regulator, partial [Gammaproteobacteria bacterium]